MYDCIRLCVLCTPEQQGCCRGRVSSPLMGCLERAVATLDGGGGGTKTTIQNNTKQYKTKQWDRFAAIVQSLQGGVSGVLSQTEAAARR